MRSTGWNYFITGNGATFFFVGLIFSLYYYIVEQYVSNLSLGVMIVGLFMVLILAPPKEED